LQKQAFSVKIKSICKLDNENRKLAVGGVFAVAEGGSTAREARNKRACHGGIPPI